MCATKTRVKLSKLFELGLTCPSFMSRRRSVASVGAEFRKRILRSAAWEDWNYFKAGRAESPRPRMPKSSERLGKLT